MADVVELGKFAAARSSSGTTSVDVKPSQDGSWFRSSEERSSAGFLSAAALRKLDDESPVGKMLGLIELTLNRLETCMQHLHQKEMFSGDDEFMATKKLLSELLMFRDVNDSVGLIAWTAYQACQIEAITDAPILPEVLHRVLTRLWSSPFMRFEEACLLVEEVEEAVSVAPVAGHVQISEELLAEQNQD